MAGGGKNANEILVGIAELLIHRRLIKRILLTRLPVGHTHEDINGKFETIWQHIVGIAYCWYCSIFETISWYCGTISIGCILRIFGV